ncbi:protein FAM210A [Drosophila eugracilis]|uniref:protein FAM210A n=1 Tax=Drosophila eugracilis TaxID=29029 RepID=UPI0007E7E468|nr:protein FAM210A [Drosophila eugracilis]XP_017078080.1 protein FAM210A [Drosophila eugracilis]
MATVALLARHRLVACSLRLLTSAHSRGLTAMVGTEKRSVPSDSWTLKSRRIRLLPTVTIRFNHKTANPAATAPAPSPAANDSSVGNKDLKATSTTSSELFGEAANMGLFAKFKHMYKQYWYVLIPVHVFTSVGWFGGFYYLSKSGVDVPALLQYVHLSENIIEKVQGSDMGHYAIAYLCYKVATPLRYALTLGCTTVSIKYLVQHGYIKPMPTKSELIKMYEDKKATRASAKADKAEKDESK